MSVITLVEAKSFLDVIHGGDDVKLQMLLDGAEDEALRFMNRASFSGAGGAALNDDEDDTIEPSIKIGVLLFLQATYQATPDDAAKLRRAGEIKLFPRRCGMGV